MEPERQKALYPIGIVAELLNIHPRTLRIYEQEGLIKPARRGGKRFYSNIDLQWLRCLRKLLTDEGLNIAGIKKLLTIAPCWSIRDCDEETRKQCPAILNFPVPCWELKPRCCKDSDLACSDCEVYRHKMDRVIMLKCPDSGVEKT
ncbi:MerR family transcriptional regulator [Syntrophobacter fumaroxidans]|uniref:Transcriptional regulator, MerR family n=1 Tax=Syntrophobacter fumaroxidans (strain DSM 10017 / MPOB) TaxID=335543 RepID=A0LF58_SYNFM|nr:MerR family transcriptional regulator [Syntrophobacter fumaroxidans]ABK16060.1 transcriptional regulator, MerR family [Syntrophobacter fumaroxidans MPOB]